MEKVTLKGLSINFEIKVEEINLENLNVETIEELKTDIDFIHKSLQRLETTIKNINN